MFIRVKFPTSEWRRTREEGQGHAAAASPKSVREEAPDIRLCGPDLAATPAPAHRTDLTNQFSACAFLIAKIFSHHLALQFLTAIDSMCAFLFVVVFLMLNVLCFGGWRGGAVAVFFFKDVFMFHCVHVDFYGSWTLHNMSDCFLFFMTCIQRWCEIFQMQVGTRWGYKDRGEMRRRHLAFVVLSA